MAPGTKTGASSVFKETVCRVASDVTSVGGTLPVSQGPALAVHGGAFADLDVLWHDVPAWETVPDPLIFPGESR